VLERMTYLPSCSDEEANDSAVCRGHERDNDDACNFRPADDPVVERTTNRSATRSTRDLARRATPSHAGRTTAPVKKT
jgi:hypothetical protein